MTSLRRFPVRLTTMIWAFVIAMPIAIIAWYLWRHYFALLPEEQVTSVIMRAKAAIEAKQLKGFMHYISSDYHDSTGLTYEDIKDAAMNYVRNQDLRGKIDIHAMTVYTRRGIAAVDMRARITIMVGENSYTTKLTTLTIFLRKEIFWWRISAIEGWQRFAEELPIEEFAYY